MNERSAPTPPRPAKHDHRHRGSAPAATKRVDEEPLDETPSVQKIEPKRRRSDFPLRYGR